MWFPHCFHMKANLFLTILSMLSYFGFLKKKAGLLFFVSKTLVEWSSDRFSHLTPFLDSTRFLIKKDHIYSMHIFTYAPSWSQQDVKNVYFTVLFMKPTGKVSLISGWTQSHVCAAYDEIHLPFKDSLNHQKRQVQSFCWNDKVLDGIEQVNHNIAEICVLWNVFPNNIKPPLQVHCLIKWPINQKYVCLLLHLWNCTPGNPAFLKVFYHENYYTHER